MGERGVQHVEVRASKRPKPLEIEDADGCIGSVVLAELEDLLRGARGDPGCGDDGKRDGVLPSSPACLEHSLGEERHEAIRATFGSGFHHDGVGYTPSPRAQVRRERPALRLALDVPAGALQCVRQDTYGLPRALEGFRPSLDSRLWHQASLDSKYTMAM
jgi:hypothetical protein